MEIALHKPQGPGDWLRLQRLYTNAFPRNERKPFAVIRRMFREGKGDIWCILAEGKFAGLATTVKGSDLILIDYFAVSQKQRGKGIGKAAMECLLSLYPGRGVFLEIESPERPGLDREQRKSGRNSTCPAALRNWGSRQRSLACIWSCWASAVKWILRPTAVSTAST